MRYVPGRYTIQSSLVLVIAMMSFKHILRRCSGGYKLTTLQEKINHLMYIDVIKLFVNNEKELETLIQAVRIYSQVIGMKFGFEKCAMLRMRSRKRQMTERIKLQIFFKNQITRRKRNLQILRNIGSLHHQTSGNESKNEKSVSQENEKIFPRNPSKGTYTRAVLLVRYPGLYLK